MLKNTIIADRNLSFKDNFKKTILGTVLGELDRTSKNPSDADVVKVVKKMIESNKEIGSDDAIRENEILSVYLPATMSTQELTDKITEFITANGIKEPREMGKVMSYLSQNFPGKYDGKETSEIVKRSI